jgi:hypothetical protein
VSKALARRGALGADVQRAVVAAGVVDSAEAAVCLGEGPVGGRQGVALQGGDTAGGVFGFLLFLVFAGASLLCLAFLGLFEFCLFASVAGCFSDLDFFLFSGELSRSNSSPINWPSRDAGSSLSSKSASPTCTPAA